MKKTLALLLALVLACSTAACGSRSAPTENSSIQNSSSSVEEDGGVVEVDKGLLNVDITLPASFFTDTTEEDIKTSADEKGYSKCVVNADGSVTYTMTKAQHKEMLNELKTSCDESIDELLNGETAVESFQKIEYNDDISEVDIYVDSSKYGAFDAMYALPFYFMGAYYQIFSGVSPDQADVTVNFIDQDTKQVLDTASYRDWITNMESSNTQSSNQTKVEG